MKRSFARLSLTMGIILTLNQLGFHGYSTKVMAANPDAETVADTVINEASEIVNIPDKNLHKAIIEQLKKLPSDLTVEDMEQLRTLDLQNTMITNLEGLQYAVNLESLHIGSNEITDLTPLSSLINLKILNINSYSNIVDLQPLESLTNLGMLSLTGEKIADLSPIAKLVNLQTLDLRGKQIKDISPLAHLQKLSSLGIEDTQIRDITPLKSLTALRFLTVGNSQVDSISPLADLKSLSYLRLDGNEISDLTPLSGLSNLRSLSLNGNNITELTPLKNLNGLNSIGLSGNNISDIDVLASLNYLQVLELSHNPLTDISPLKNLTWLKTLYLENAGISDISPLGEMTDLEQVRLENNMITDLNPLSALTKMTDLSLAHNKISDITPLYNLGNLDFLDLSYNQIINYSPFSGIWNLYINNNFIAGKRDQYKLVIPSNYQSIVLGEKEMEIPYNWYFNNELMYEWDDYVRNLVTIESKNNNVSVSIVEPSAGNNGKIILKGSSNGVDEVTLKFANPDLNKTIKINEIDLDRPAAPIVNKVADFSEAVSGKAEPYVSITAKVNGRAWDMDTSADQDGNFSLWITPQKAGTEIELTAVDRAGNTSDTVKVIVVDETAPAAPIVEKVTVDTASIKGKAEKESEITVKIGSQDWNGTADADGDFSINIPTQKAGTIIEVTAKDTAGNVSSAAKVIVVDEIPPAPPVVNGVTDLHTQITGTAEQNATVIAKVSGNEIGRTEANASGHFVMEIEKQQAGSYIQIFVIDAAGNSSDITEIEVTDEKPNIQKLVGKTRYTTAVEISKAGWDKSDTVFLVNGWAIADGLTATPLAAAKDAPILLTTKNSLPEETLSEIERLQAKEIVFIGGSGVISDQLKSSLFAKGYQVTRIGGKTRYETSLLIAQELDKLIDVQTVYLAYGHGEPDALSIAAQSGQTKQPIILSDKNAVPSKTYSWLKGEGLDTSYFIGGKGVISPAILNEMNQITSKNVLNNRLSGVNRQETNAKVIETFYNQSEMPTIMVAHSNTAKLVDALAAGPLAAKFNVPVLLVSSTLADSQISTLEAKQSENVHQVGGGIGEPVLKQVVDLMN
ncbi:leucine-rich repeat domain-containing protein [Sporosarcina globispora]|uniref:leucine-rich repeat domain-containing protein n=1 Tax=Sporosarcina globispora TaxID=1459 RepID=UPI0006A9C65F|nr:leucine-rich repeat domain-containing protein [Sporosarcina globispora]